MAHGFMACLLGREWYIVIADSHSIGICSQYFRRCILLLCVLLPSLFRPSVDVSIIFHSSLCLHFSLSPSHSVRFPDMCVLFRFFFSSSSLLICHFMLTVNMFRDKLFPRSGNKKSRRFFFFRSAFNICMKTKIYTQTHT